MNNERNKKRTMKNDVHLSSFIIHYLFSICTEAAIGLWGCEVVVLIVRVVEEYYFFHAKEGKTIGEETFNIRNTACESRTTRL